MNNDIEYLKMAYRVAYNESTDPSTQNGAILVDINNIIISQGANHFPQNVKESEERWDPAKKLLWVEHAERQTIYSAAKKGAKIDGSTMYCCWAACTDCARAIIQTGIKEVVTHHSPLISERFGIELKPYWKDSIAIAMTMFEESGVKFRWIEDKLFYKDELLIRFSGKLINP